MPDENKNRDLQRDEERRANRDPITGSPGSHPVGTGVGAAAGGAAGVAGGAAAGAAAGTAAGGPVGAIVGGAVGAVGGGLAGKAVAERVNPTEEEAHWRENYRNEPYYDPEYTYDDYAGAYRTGYMGYGKLGGTGKHFEEVETDLRNEYERDRGSSRLSWEQARPAAHAAWNRFDRHLEQYIGYDVVDRNGNHIGTLDCLWSDHTGQPAFVGVLTGWFLGKTHVVPAQSVDVSERNQRLRLPYTEEKVRNAPAYDAEEEMNEAREREIYRYYEIEQPMHSAPASTEMRAREATSRDVPPKIGTESREEATMPLTEEKVKVGKREVEAGGVRLRKVVRTEVVNQPVELRREEVVIERVPVERAQEARERASEENEVYIPLRREEAVVSKEARVREEVRVRKESHTDRQDVSETVRKEDVEIDRSGEASEEFNRGNPSSASDQVREAQTKPRSQRQRKS
jgi:uncharacterized protein (TIGR02271 family)